MSKIEEALALVLREIEDANEAGDGVEELERAAELLRLVKPELVANAMRERRIDSMSGRDVLALVQRRLGILAEGERKKAGELLEMVQQLAPHQHVNRELDQMAGLARKAALRQRVMSAYIWALHDIEGSLGEIDTFDERDRAYRNHPTELDD